MANNGADALVAQYLKDLEHALRPLSAGRRRQIVADVAAHIAEARARLAVDDEVGVRQVLERVGDPGRIAEEAGATVAPSAPGADAWVPWLLLFGAFAFGVGWVVGAVLLWNSRAWSLRQKLLGTLVWPGGLVLPMMVLGMPGGSTFCSGGSGQPIRCVTTGYHLPLVVGIPLLMVLMLAPVVTAVYLNRVRRVES